MIIVCTSVKNAVLTFGVIPMYECIIDLTNGWLRDSRESAARTLL